MEVPAKESDLFLKATQLTVKAGDNSLAAEFLLKEEERTRVFFYFEITGAPLTTDRFIELTLETEQIECYELPKNSILWEEDQAYTFAKEGNTTTKTEIAVMREFTDTVLVTGLNDGMRIVTDTKFVRR